MKYWPLLYFCSFCPYFCGTDNTFCQYITLSIQMLIKSFCGFRECLGSTPEDTVLIIQRDYEEDACKRNVFSSAKWVWALIIATFYWTPSSALLLELTHLHCSFPEFEIQRYACINEVNRCAATENAMPLVYFVTKLPRIEGGTSYIGFQGGKSYSCTLVFMPIFCKI